jgi:hypothetical protein
MVILNGKKNKKRTKRKNEEQKNKSHKWQQGQGERDVAIPSLQ